MGGVRRLADLAAEGFGMMGAAPRKIDMADYLKQFVPRVGQLIQTPTGPGLVEEICVECGPDQVVRTQITTVNRPSMGVAVIDDRTLMVDLRELQVRRPVPRPAPPANEWMSRPLPLADDTVLVTPACQAHVFRNGRYCGRCGVKVKPAVNCGIFRHKWKYALCVYAMEERDFRQCAKCGLTQYKVVNSWLFGWTRVERSAFRPIAMEDK